MGHGITMIVVGKNASKKETDCVVG